MIHSQLSIYTEMGEQKYGPDWDPIEHPFDGEIVIRMGDGKKHGRYTIDGSTIDMASIPNLSTIRAGAPNPDIHQGLTAA